MPVIGYTPPPTCAKFMLSNAFGRMIAGPVGSGKTTACIFELLRRALEQTPGQDGIRYTRFAITRQTLKQLKDTVVKDVRAWLGSLGEWRVSESTFYLKFHDVESEWIFIPLEDAADQARLLSMQLTGAWLSEAIEMNYDVVAPISGRLGRYPAGIKGNPTWFGLIADTNMPSEGSPWHKLMTEVPPEWTIDIQPSGMSPDAENLPYLAQTDRTALMPITDPERIAQGRRYYERFVRMYGEESDWVGRYVKAKYGEDPSGQAVFRHCFTHNFHVVNDTVLVPGYTILIGQDFGRDPWSLITQVDHLGRLVVHEEVPGEGVGLETHLMRNLRPRLMSPKYAGFRCAIVGDPAGRAKSSISEESCFDALRRMGFAAFPAPTNDLDPRLRSVEALLVRQVGGGPALMINKEKCPTLVRALGGGYRYEKSRMSNLLKAVPKKDNFSHVVDALQYACLCAHGDMLGYISTRIQRKSIEQRPRASAAGWT